jgi:hypothetical protein
MRLVGHSLVAISALLLLALAGSAVRAPAIPARHALRRRRGLLPRGGAQLRPRARIQLRPRRTHERFQSADASAADPAGSRARAGARPGGVLPHRDVRDVGRRRGRVGDAAALELARAHGARRAGGRARAGRGRGVVLAGRVRGPEGLPRHGRIFGPGHGRGVPGRRVQAWHPRARRAPCGARRRTPGARGARPGGYDAARDRGIPGDVASGACRTWSGAKAVGALRRRRLGCRALPALEPIGVLRLAAHLGSGSSRRSRRWTWPRACAPCSTPR